jgi:hypothetical protein
VVSEEWAHSVDNQVHFKCQDQVAWEPELELEQVQVQQHHLNNNQVLQEQVQE